MQDMELGDCSVAARGLWFDMLRMAHESSNTATCGQRRGVTVEIVDSIRGAMPSCWWSWKEGRVRARRLAGIYCRRMVRDEHPRETRRLRCARRRARHQGRSTRGEGVPSTGKLGGRREQTPHKPR
jgi:hypothetical protein